MILLFSFENMWMVVLSIIPSLLALLRIIVFQVLGTTMLSLVQKYLFFNFRFQWLLIAKLAIALQVWKFILCASWCWNKAKVVCFLYCLCLLLTDICLLCFPHMVCHICNIWVRISNKISYGLWVYYDKWVVMSQVRTCYPFVCVFLDVLLFLLCGWHPFF